MLLLLMTLTAQGSGLELHHEMVRPVAGHAVFDLRVGIDGVTQGDQLGQASG